jgi:hypothetical protein
VRWPKEIKPVPIIGQLRVIERFVFFKKIGMQRRFLEFSRWEEVYRTETLQSGSDFSGYSWSEEVSGWIPTRWLPDLPNQD